MSRVEFGKYYPSAIDEDYPDEGRPRGATWNGVLIVFTGGLLRFGFLIQFVSIVIGIMNYYSAGGTGIFSFDLFSTSENLRTNSTYTGKLILLESLFLIGSMLLAGFQIFLADNSKETRGFRAGSKMLSTAATLDIYVAALRLMQYFYAYNYLANRWWLKYIQSSSDWCLFYSSSVLHSIALCLYGMGIFYMESYHDRSERQALAWQCLIIFKFAAFSELLHAFTRLGCLTTFVQLIAVLLATVWSCSFEPTVLSLAPAFHDRDVNSGILSEGSTRVPSSAVSVTG